MGVKQDRSSDNKVGKNYSQSMQNGLQLAGNVGANVASQNNSIARCLPSHNQSMERPIIVKFSRRIAKTEIPQTKKQLGTLSDLKHIKISEDLTLPSLRTPKKLNQTRESTRCGQERDLSF